MDKNLEKLADQYEGNLFNYFCGMTPKQSKKFNKIVKDAKNIGGQNNGYSTNSK